MPATQEINLVGKIQDISNLLVMANTAEMPLTSMIRKGSKPNNTLVEYPIDKYAEPRVQGVPDGKDADAFDDEQKNRALLYARTMRVWRNPMVTTMAQEVARQAGDSGNKMLQAKAKAVVELKQDIEGILLGNQDSAVQTNADNASVTRGLGKWIQSAAQSDLPVPAAFRPSAGQIYSGTIAAFSEDSLRAVLQARWTTVKRAGDLVAFVGSEVKNKISDFVRYDNTVANKTAVRRFDSGNGGTFGSTVDIYKGDFGTVKVFLSSFVPDQYTGLIVDMNKVELRPTTLPRVRDLPDGGAGPRAIADAIFALANTDPQSHGKIAATAA